MIAHEEQFSDHANAFGVLHVWSPGTDLLILFNHFKPCILTSVYMFWQGKAYDILGVLSHPGPLKSSGIFTWHPITGCNTTGRFSRRGKKTWWGLYISLVPEMDKDILHDFSEFRESADLLESTENSLSRFTALGYAKRSDVLPLARWKHFTKKMAEGEKLPPTPSAFK